MLFLPGWCSLEATSVSPNFSFSFDISKVPKVLEVILVAVVVVDGRWLVAGGKKWAVEANFDYLLNRYWKSSF